MRNINTQSATTPANLGGETPPSEFALLAAGWRYEPEVPPVAEGYTRVSIAFVEGDGRTGAWQVVDRPTTEIDAEQAAANADAEAARQLAKSDALKLSENRFLLFCEQLTGSRAKAGFADLRAVLESMAANPATVGQALVLAAQLTAINDECFREGGLRWWDDCTWHQEVAT